jgi:hypothetical protein
LLMNTWSALACRVPSLLTEHAASGHLETIGVVAREAARLLGVMIASGARLAGFGARPPTYLVLVRLSGHDLHRDLSHRSVLWTLEEEEWYCAYPIAIRALFHNLDVLMSANCSQLHTI